MPRTLKLQFVLYLALAVPAGAWSTATYTSSSCRFPDANQKLCYNNSTGIGCPAPGGSFFGQDANYAPAPTQLSYTVHNPVAGKSVTVDNRTGLVWESTGSNNGNAASSWAAAISVCENSSFAGYTDWRLPNAKELASLLDYSKGAAPYIDTTAFPTAQSAYYWTSTSVAMNPTSAFTVSFYDGLVSGDSKTSTINPVRCVRGGP